MSAMRKFWSVGVAAALAGSACSSDPGTQAAAGFPAGGESSSSSISGAGAGGGAQSTSGGGANSTGVGGTRSTSIGGAQSTSVGGVGGTSAQATGGTGSVNGTGGMAAAGSASSASGASSSAGTGGGPVVIEYPALAAGTYHTLLLRQGIAWAFGSNRAGELGTGSSNGATELVPLEIQLVSDVVLLAAGGYQSLALNKSGRVWSWGANEAGQRGDGSPSSDLNGNGTPVLLPSFGTVVSISSGARHNLALTKDGKVFGWGANEDGQVGNGGPVSGAPCGNGVGSTAAQYQVHSPVQVTLPVAIKQISAGYCTSFAVDLNGDVWSWGFGDYLGANLAQAGVSATAVSTPAKVQGLSNVVEVSAGEQCHFALRTDGTVWAWGVNRPGCVGTGTTQPVTTPVKVPIDQVKHVASGNATGYVVRTDGSLYAWGYSSHGEVGDGTHIASALINNENANVPTPVKIESWNDVKRIDTSSSATFVFVTRADGSVWSWGRNKAGNLGNGKLGDATHDNVSPDDENVSKPARVFPPFP